VAFGIEQVEQEEGLVLIADADGSANIECLAPMMERLIQTIENQRQSTSDNKSVQASSSFWSTPVIVVGNRGSASDNDESSSSTSQKKILLRSILRWGFRTTVQIFLVGRDLGGVRDTQCGFKLLTVAAAQPLYSNLNLQRWTHDVEVLFRASSTIVAIGEQPIEWQDKDGSKLVDGLGGVAGISLSMLLQVLQMRLAYEFGIWK
jgi:dolichyl-phosphate beta-glucosyltransferase